MFDHSPVCARYCLHRTLIIVALSSLWSIAVADFAATEAEYMAWPDYCRAKYGLTNIGGQLGYAGRESMETVRKAKAFLGPFFVHVHHYCWGLAEEKRYQRSREYSVRKHWLRSALGDAVYSLNRIKPDNVLYPHVVSLTARLYYNTGRPEKAIELLEDALVKRPATSMLYYHKAFVLRKISRRKEAREVLETGITMIEEPSADYHYLYGLICLEIGDLECARKEAARAYAMGYPLPGLARKLERKGIRLK